MNEVSCRACSPIVDAIELTGVGVDSLIGDLDFTVDHLLGPTNRIAWDDFAVFMERATETLGGYAAIERVGIDHAENPATGLIRMLASRFVSLRLAYTLGAKWYGPSFFANTTGDCEELPDGRIQQVVEILPGYRHSQAFFHLLRGVLISTPLTLGLEPAKVALHVELRRGVYTISLPAAPSWLRSLGMRFRPPESEKATLDELRFQHAQLNDALARAETSRVQLKEQSAELETVNTLGRRLTGKINLDELSDLIVRLCTATGGASGVALWMLPEDGGPAQLLRSSGEQGGRSDTRLALRSGGNTVGFIDLWGDFKSVLYDLTPWIGLALDNARSFDALGAKTRHLEIETRNRLSAEKQLQHVQKMEAVGRLAGGMAHDFSNALMTINGYAEILCDSSHQPAEVRLNSDRILSEVERSTKLVQRTLSFSRVDLNSSQLLDVNAMIDSLEDVLRSMASESIQLRTAMTTDRTIIFADPSGVEQIIVNLVTNSIDAMPDGGELTLRTSVEHLDPGDLETTLPYAAAEFVRIDVSDTGPGIDPKLRPRLFEPFATTKPVGKGTGLGLAIVYGIVKSARGAISVDSTPGEGTTISVCLPCAEGEPEVVNPRSVARQARRKGNEIVLLVEDEDSLRSVLQTHIERAGYRVLAASCGAEALTICNTHDGPVDLVVTDVRMPGIDGPTLVAQLRELRKDLGPVIFMTAYAGEATGDLPRDAHVLRKPLPVSDLLTEMANAVDSA